MKGPVVTAIVLNFNGLGHVEQAVRSLVAQDLAGLEVVLVDNGSSDGSAESVERLFGDRVRLIRNGRNLGYGAGNNVGIRASSAPHVILLNNDAVAAASFARELVAAADADPRIGMVAAKVLLHEPRGHIDTLGHLMYADGLNRGRGRLEEDRGQYDACRTALFPSGAAALYRRAMLEEIGLFDESFFLYGDDAELGLRGRLAGWGCALAPRAVATHHYSRSAGAYSRLKAFHVERNRVWVLLKLFPLSRILVSFFYTKLRFALQAWGGLTGRGAAGQFARRHGALDLVVVATQAYLAALWGLPRVLSERRRLRSLRRLSTRELTRLLDDYRLSAREVALKD